MTTAAPRSNETLERIKAAATKNAALEAKFVRTKRYDHVFEEILMLHEQRKAAAATGTLRKARGLALLAPTGSGKTRTLDVLFSELETLNGKSGRPGDRLILSVKVKTPANLKSVGVAILRELGCIGQESPKRRDTDSASDIWEVIHWQLQQQGVEILHLDEAQDLLESANVLQRRAVLSTLKTLTQNDQWPVCLVLSGTETLQVLLNEDPQLARRLNVIGIPALAYATDRKMLTSILTQFVEGARFETGGLDQDAFLPRLIAGSANRLGIFMELVIGAIVAATLDGSSKVELRHFAAAFERRTDCASAENPFLAEDWHKIDVWKLFAKAIDKPEPGRKPRRKKSDPPPDDP
ncbi:TniB protein [Rhodobacter viridis]|uniref:TniB protein n=1 Tax=Rhodobacter viridis TaxID=1054202 RepID=A0A318TV01_9RHOB|nr:TniB family NTP-binding protein [Rhodobacter viridis]PYF08153.1 TniB protein [Rhodobacter viridis]